MSTGITVRASADGQIEFVVRWAEPMEQEFGSRLDAERFAALLAGSHITPDLCAACLAHHQSAHGCPSCRADLGLRVGAVGGRIRPVPEPLPVEPDRFLVVREQHRIRVEQIERERAEWAEELRRADARLRETGAIAG